MALSFEAKKHSYRQVQDGIVVSFVVHPNDVNADFAVAPLGTRYMVALAEIGDDEQPTSSGAAAGTATATLSADTSAPPLARVAPEEGARQYTLANRVGMLCNDEAFRLWIDGEMGMHPGYTQPEFAAVWVRRRCGVKSRSEIVPGTDAAKQWVSILTRFEQATGRAAAPR